MRLILVVQLVSGNFINIVANVHNTNEAKLWAMQNSAVLLPDPTLHITEGCNIVSLEKWSQDKAVSYQHGGKTYLAAFFMDGISQYIKIEAAGVKSAYNNIKLKYGIQENLSMIIYEVNQSIRKRSALKSGAEILKDNNKLNLILTKAYSKMKTFPALGEYAADIPLMISLLRDYSSGKYREIPVGTIVALVASILYFISPVDFIPDIVPGLCNVDDIGILVWALKQVHDDLQEYAAWLSANENEVVVG